MLIVSSSLFLSKNKSDDKSKKKVYMDNQELKFYHTPVLIKETVSLLNCSPGSIILDCTLGAGGHSTEILNRILPGGRLICIDRDSDAIDAFRQFAAKFPENIELIKGNFSNLDKILNSLKIDCVDGILFDIGVSSYQLTSPQRGFTFQIDSPLDMRMDREDTLTAADIVNTFSERELADIIYKYGEERKSREIAREIVKSRETSRISSTIQLRDIVKKVLKFSKKSDIHPATKTFMALRIFLNCELDSLEKGISKAFQSLKQGGRLVVISFHSLEDRIVKRFFSLLSRRCRCHPDMPLCRCEGRPLARLINKKVIFPSKEELSTNPRSRSARLRALEKL